MPGEKETIVADDGTVLEVCRAPDGGVVGFLMLTQPVADNGYGPAFEEVEDGG